MTETQKGIALMILTAFIFAAQDGISRHLASEYNVLMVVMIRYWFFAVFVIALATRATGGLRQVAATAQPLVQLTRGLLLTLEVCVMIYAFTLLGLVESHAVFAAYPLIVAALSGPILGEQVGWRRWTAICIGLVGVLIILQPGLTVFSPYALVPVCSALLFALYNLLTRYAARKDTSMTSFFWAGIVGAVTMTLVGVWEWEPMSRSDWGWMLTLCCTACLGHWTLIKCYEFAEASEVQPFAYLQLVFATAIGLLLFGEVLKWNVATGAVVVICAGLFTLWRTRAKTT